MHDAIRTAYLEAQGFDVMRFWNVEIAQDLHGVVETILARIATPSSQLDHKPAPAGQYGTSPC